MNNPAGGSFDSAYMSDVFSASFNSAESDMIQSLIVSTILENKIRTDYIEFGNGTIDIVLTPGGGTDPISNHITWQYLGRIRLSYTPDILRAVFKNHCLHGIVAALTLALTDIECDFIPGTDNLACTCEESCAPDINFCGLIRGEFPGLAGALIHALLYKNDDSLMELAEVVCSLI